MKKLFYLFIISAALIMSCGKDHPNPASGTTGTNNSNSLSFLFYGEAPTDTLQWNSGLSKNEDIPGIGTGLINEYSSSFTGATANNDISIKFTLPQDTPTIANYNAFFKPSTINFAPENSLNGVFFYYVDPSGGYWGTGLGSQTNSFFTISKVESTNNYTIITATFNCILYNSSGQSTSFSLKNGMVRCLIPLYN